MAIAIRIVIVSITKICILDKDRHIGITRIDEKEILILILLFHINPSKRYSITFFILVDTGTLLSNQL